CHQNAYKSARLRGDGKAVVFSALGVVSGLLRRGEPDDLDTSFELLDEAQAVVAVESPGKTYEMGMYGLIGEGRMVEGSAKLGREAGDQAVERIIAIGRPNAYYAVDGYTLTPDVFLTLWEGETDPAEREALKQQAAISCKALHAYARTYFIGR